MDNIPMVPAGACLCQLCRSRGTEYQSPYFFFSRCFCCQAYYNHYNDAEQEHPSAEEQPVHIIEQIFECTASYISCITVIYFCSQTCQTDYHTGDQSPHTTLCRSTLPADTQQEGCGDTRCQYRLYVLQVSIKHITYATHDRYPQNTQNYNHYSCHLTDNHQFLFRSFRFEAFVEVNCKQHGR